MAIIGLCDMLYITLYFMHTIALLTKQYNSGLVFYCGV